MDITWVQQALDQAQMLMFLHLHFPQASPSLQETYLVLLCRRWLQEVKCEEPRLVQKCLLMPRKPQGSTAQRSTALPGSHAKKLKQLWAVAEQWLERSTIESSLFLMDQKKRCSFRVCAGERLCWCYFNVLLSKLYLCILQFYLKWFFFMWIPLTLPNLSNLYHY